MANYVDNTIEVTTTHPVLIDLLKSALGFNDDLCDLIVPIGEWSSDKAEEAWGCSGMLDGQVSQVDTQGKFMLSGQTKWVFPVKFLEALFEKFNGGGFTTSIRCEWIEESGYVGIWEYGDEFYEQLTFEDYREYTEKFKSVSKLFYLIDLEGWFDDNMMEE